MPKIHWPAISQNRPVSRFNQSRGARGDPSAFQHELLRLVQMGLRYAGKIARQCENFGVGMRSRPVVEGEREPNPRGVEHHTQRSFLGDAGCRLAKSGCDWTRLQIRRDRRAINTLWK